MDGRGRLARGDRGATTNGLLGTGGIATTTSSVWCCWLASLLVLACGAEVAVDEPAGCK